MALQPEALTLRPEAIMALRPSPPKQRNKISKGRAGSASQNAWALQARHDDDASALEMAAREQEAAGVARMREARSRSEKVKISVTLIFFLPPR